jgi:hypothetical protein
MKRYKVTFMELRSYEMFVDAACEQTAIELAENGPENPVWLGAELDYFEAEEIAGGVE